MFEYLDPADRPVVNGLTQFEVVYAKDQPAYLSLRTLPSADKERRVLSRWTFTPEQRAAVAAGADIFLELKTFKQPLQPIRICVGEPELYSIAGRYRLFEYRGWRGWKWTGWKGVFGLDVAEEDTKPGDPGCHICSQPILKGSVIKRCQNAYDAHWPCAYPDIDPNGAERYVGQWLFSKGEGTDARFLYVNVGSEKCPKGEYQPGESFDTGINFMVDDTTSEEEKNRLIQDGLDRMYRYIDEIEAETVPEAGAANITPGDPAQ